MFDVRVNATVDKLRTMLAGVAYAEVDDGLVYVWKGGKVIDLFRCNTLERVGAFQCGGVVDRWAAAEACERWRREQKEGK